MQAIVTRYLRPSNTRGTRIKATAADGSMIFAYKYNLNIDENHAQAARALADKLGWSSDYYGELVFGTMVNGDYCHVFTCK